MNESDSDANAKAIDSLLNYETVKYFGAEQREAERYDRSMAIYEHNSVKKLCLAGGTEFRAGRDLHRRHDRADDLVRHRASSAGATASAISCMLNAMMIQLYQPLNFMGMIYREMKQALIDIGMMFDILQQPNEIAEAPDAPALIVSARRAAFRECAFRL